MRLQPFFTHLRTHVGTANGIDLHKVAWFTFTVEFRGGWEVWLQNEIAFACRDFEGAQVMQREVPYPDRVAGKYISYNKAARTAGVTPNINAAARADFTISRADGLSDTTYVELKCLLAGEAPRSAWNRFSSDIHKIRQIKSLNPSLSMMAMLATHGIFWQAEIDALAAEFSGLPNVCILDCSPGGPQISTSFAAMSPNGTARLFIIGIVP